jgi:hypothetical protein
MTKMHAVAPPAKSLGAVGALIMFATAACGSAGTQPGQLVGRNMLEYAYVHLANDLASAGPRHKYYQGPDAIPAAIAVCEKINPDAVELSVSWGGFDSWRYYYLQSDCFHQVAANGVAEGACDRMRDLDAPPPRFHLSRQRQRRATRDECRKDARLQNMGGGEYGSELLLLLLGYSREQITDGGRGLLPEDGGAYEFKKALLDGQGDDGTDYSRMEDFLQRTRRLPDVAGGDAAGGRQLDALVPGWSSPRNTSRLAEALRCVMPRLSPGDVMSDRCQELVK